MANRRKRQCTAGAIARIARETAQHSIALIEKDFAMFRTTYDDFTFTVPCLRLVARKDILQLRMQCDVTDDTIYVLRQSPIVWLSYDWKDQKGIVSSRGGNLRYIEFAWFGVTIHAHFEPTKSWKDRKFIFRFAETGASVGFGMNCSLVDSAPSTPISPYKRNRYANTDPPFQEVKDYVEGLIRIKDLMISVIDCFDELADKHL